MYFSFSIKSINVLSLSVASTLGIGHPCKDDASLVMLACAVNGELILIITTVSITVAIRKKFCFFQSIYSSFFYLQK